MSRPFATSTQKSDSPFIVALLSCVTLTFFSQCTKKPTSSLRESQNVTNISSDLGPMEIKFTFTYPGLNGLQYPVHMSANFAPQTDPNKAVWNSVIVSDGGLLNAKNESKTIKPDSNLMLNFTASTTPDVLTFSSGNPEIGRGLLLKLQRVKVNGALSWKAVSLSYFGYAAEIEDSRLIPN